ncbi:MAG: ATP-dependent DNA helicase RecG, partial [Bacteroidota bacterium]
LKKHTLVPLSEAIQNIHFPPDLGALYSATDRLKFDELFFLQLMLAMKKNGLVEKPGISFRTESPLARRLVDALPFELTKAQRRVLKEIATDMGATPPMNRLLQGDVGSGKTIVAALSALVAIDNGYQVAFMAPTEVLAEQHYKTLGAYLSGMPVNVRLLIGGQKKKLREDILEDIRSGGAALVVGTHALIESNVNFHKLGLVIIDEQHRFGVLQRATLQQKGTTPDVLVMTATPIPRTLAMTLYGDLDISTIDELPANRRLIKTAVRTESQKQKVYDFVKSEVQSGRQVYIVFPLIEESEKLDLKAATKEFELLQKKVFPEASLGLLHGRMKSEEKDDVMSRFKSGKIHILVSTTVIEVGIDVPNASVMIIENAERFGLSQLHQLRGRVGRGTDQSYCILISNAQLYAKSLKGLDPDELEREELNAKTRLETMVNTGDGFKIAEVDLRLRGPGDFFGTKQSGVPGLRLANLVEDVELVSRARTEAFDLVHRDPQLRDPANLSIRHYFESHYKNLIALGETS